MSAALKKHLGRPPFYPSAAQLDLCDRADAGVPILNLIREDDVSRARFYHLYFRIRGVRWSQAHPRAFNPKRGKQPSSRRIENSPKE